MLVNIECPSLLVGKLLIWAIVPPCVAHIGVCNTQSHNGSPHCSRGWMIRFWKCPFPRWSIPKMVHSQDGPFPRWSIPKVVHSQGGPFPRWSIPKMVYSQDGPKPAHNIRQSDGPTSALPTRHRKPAVGTYITCNAAQKQWYVAKFKSSACLTAPGGTRPDSVMVFWYLKEKMVGGC